MNRKKANVKTAAFKAELKALLAQPLIARGVSTRYITSGSTPIVDDIIQNQRQNRFVLVHHTRLTVFLQITRPC
jgi:ATP-dependent RNA helicase DDX24/MAK5